jgi:hypothetical protein
VKNGLSLTASGSDTAARTWAIRSR